MRLLALDGLRGVLAFVVLLDHILLLNGIEALRPAAGVAVVTFFGLSGLVLTRAWSNAPLIFLGQRFLRLAPVWIACVVAGCALLGRLAWPTEADPPTWSLNVEADACIAFPAIVWAGTTWTRVWIVSVLLCSIAFIISPYCADFAAFVVGSRLAAFPDTRFRCRALEGLIPQWLGKVSYSLYLSHWIVLAVGFGLAGGLGAVVAAPLAIPVAWGLWRAIERPSIAASRLIGTELTCERISKFVRADR